MFDFPTIDLLSFFHAIQKRTT